MADLDPIFMFDPAHPDEHLEESDDDGYEIIPVSNIVGIRVCSNFQIFL